MSANRTEEDWFLRGGERPKNDNERTQTPVVTCQNCGGDNLADEECCTHYGAVLTGGASTEEYCGSEHGENPCDECDGRTRCDDCPHNRGDDDGDDGELQLYEVKVTRSITQTATVRVRAATECGTMNLVEEQAENGDLDTGNLDWTDEEDSAYDDEFMAESAKAISRMPVTG